VTTFRTFRQLSPNEIAGEVFFSINEADSHHAIKVLRLKESDIISVIDRTSSREFEAIVLNNTSPLQVRITNELPCANNPSLLGCVIFALCKGSKNDFVIEKGTELGAREILLWMAERSVVKINSEKEIQAKLKRWKAIAESAAKQSKRRDVPEIHFAQNLLDLESKIKQRSSPTDVGLLGSLSMTAVHPSLIPKPQGLAHVAIGPEGDFTENEHLKFEGLGFTPITLGPNVLRSETAAISIMTLPHILWPVS